MLRLSRNVVDTASGTGRIAFHIPLIITNTQTRGETYRITSSREGEEK